MDFDGFQKYLNKTIKFFFGVLLFLIIVGVLHSYNIQKNTPPEQRNKTLDERLAKAYHIDLNENYPKPWPPEMNSPYPDYVLIDQKGEKFNLSDYKGMIIAMEMVDMSSPVSQALSGAEKYGVYGATQTYDKFVKPLSEALKEETKGALTLPNPNILTIKVLFYRPDGGQALPADAENWAAHFKLKKEDNVIVAVPEKDMRGDTTGKIVPGYQLIDQDMVLRVDSAGPVPKHNYEMTLVPMIPKLLK